MNIAPNELKRLMDRYGPPGYENLKKQVSRLNENFWAACYATQGGSLVTKMFVNFEPVCFGSDSRSATCSVAPYW
jgi:hypothetical protein